MHMLLSKCWGDVGTNPILYVIITNTLIYNTL